MSATDVDCVFCGDPCRVKPNGAYCGDCDVYAEWKGCRYCDGTGWNECDIPWCSDEDHISTCHRCDGTGERPFIRIPVSAVPWVSGTVADLECNRRRDIDWNCCRFPKSCSAFDPGFRTGKGPTTLPIVWFDGYGYRSGPPHKVGIPAHLFPEIQARWEAVRPREEVSDAGGCG